MSKMWRSSRLKWAVNNSRRLDGHANNLVPRNAQGDISYSPSTLFFSSHLSIINGPRPVSARNWEISHSRTTFEPDYDLLCTFEQRGNFWTTKKTVFRAFKLRNVGETFLLYGPWIVKYNFNERYILCLPLEGAMVIYDLLWLQTWNYRY